MIEPQTIRVRITRHGKVFFEGDLQVYPWHIGNYGGDWTMWLSAVAPEWVDRTASGIQDETFHATATDLEKNAALADVQFTHTTTTPEAFIAHMANQDPARLEADRAAAWGIRRDED
ncbi:hypothetical protein [Streptomyces sp. KL116D]|uniref:hypothetical protein n=1 Tax=Streptomyces sp. KL116D TaxID=3045152 RepID=UPI003556ED1A